MSMLQSAALSGALVFAGIASGAHQDPPDESLPLQTADPADSMLAAQQDRLWGERLLDADLDRREHHYAHLIDAVRRAPELRGMLQRWAQDPEHAELAWTARLALRELAHQPAWMFKGGSNMRGFGPANPFFSERPTAPAGAEAGVPESDGGAVLGQKTMSFHIGPEGARVRIEREVDGERVVETHEAATLRELFEDPHVAGQVPTQLRVQNEAPPDLWAQLEKDVPAVRTDKLGVEVRAITATERAFLGLEAGVGVVVDKVAPNTIASSLGLRPGLALVKVNDHPLKVADDIQVGLEQRGEGGEVRVMLVDRFGRVRSRAWSPAPVVSPPRPPEAIEERR
jgi:hypothetical protein